VKFACACTLPVTERPQIGAAPVHAPVQLTNLNPASAVAVNVITEPGSTLAEQVLPQSTTPVLLVISPLPPDILTDIVALTAGTGTGGGSGGIAITPGSLLARRNPMLRKMSVFGSALYRVVEMKSNSVPAYEPPRMPRDVAGS